MSDRQKFWEELDPKYRAILCDAWGVIHDGVRLEPGAAERLLRWRGEGRFVIVLTNAPRPPKLIERQLERLGLPADAFDAIVSSGGAGVAALTALAAPVGFLGTVVDRRVLEDEGIVIAPDEHFADVACVGFEEGRPELADSQERLVRWTAMGVRMHCLNPDRVVIYGSRAPR